MVLYGDYLAYQQLHECQLHMYIVHCIVHVYVIIIVQIYASC